MDLVAGTGASLTRIKEGSYYVYRNHAEIAKMTPHHPRLVAENVSPEVWKLYNEIVR